MKKNINFLYPLIGIIAITGIVLILWITPFGAGVQPDSIIYMNGASSLLAGKGFSNNGIPVTHFPPLYSIFLVTANLFVRNFVQAARILNAILFGINAGLVALAVYLSSGRSYLTASCAGLFFLVSAPLLVMHAWALTEPFFITLSVVCILLLRLYVKRPTLSLLIASSLTLGLAIITRYAGLAFLPAALVVVFIARGDQPRGRRSRDTLLWTLLACLPLIILLVINLFRAGSAADRNFVYHPVSEMHFLGNLKDIGLSFIAPVSLPVWVWPACLGLVAGYFIAQIRIVSKLRREDINWRLDDIVIPALCLLFSVSYVLFLFISMTFFDASTPVDARILSPILALLIPGGFLTIRTIAQILKQPVLWWIFLLLVVISISVKAPDAIRSAESVQQNGLGYTSLEWRNSDEIAFVRSLANGVKVYTNGPDVIGYLTTVQSLSLPKKRSPTTLIAIPGYTEEMGSMCQDILENRALLVYFNVIKRSYLPSQEDIASTCKLPIRKRFADGIVYGKK